MRAPFPIAFLVACAVGSGQRIVTVAGLPYSHRADIDGRDALEAPLHRVYGLLLDRTTGRLLLHDEDLVERLEPDGSPAWADCRTTTWRMATSQMGRRPAISAWAFCAAWHRT